MRIKGQQRTRQLVCLLLTPFKASTHGQWARIWDQGTSNQKTPLVNDVSCEGQHDPEKECGLILCLFLLAIFYGVDHGKSPWQNNIPQFQPPSKQI